MKKNWILNQLTENKVFRINAKGKRISFSQQRKILLRPYRRELSAVWKANKKSILEIISTIDGKWKIQKDEHKYIFVPENPSDKKWIVLVDF